MYFKFYLIKFQTYNSCLDFIENFFDNSLFDFFLITLKTIKDDFTFNSYEYLLNTIFYQKVIKVQD